MQKCGCSMNVNNVDRVYISINVKVFGDFNKYQKYQYINTLSVNDVIAITIHSCKRTKGHYFYIIISSNINRFRNNFFQTFFFFLNKVSALEHNQLMHVSLYTVLNTVFLSASLKAL